jgi:high-affinity K+ transport system ATPase subunit B
MADSVRRWVTEQGGSPSAELDRIVERVARSGATPLAVADGSRLLGVIELKDIVKQGIRERFAQMRAIGIRTVMSPATTRSPPRPSPKRPESMTTWPKPRPTPRWT